MIIYEIKSRGLSRAVALQRLFSNIRSTDEDSNCYLLTRSVSPKKQTTFTLQQGSATFLERGPDQRFGSSRRAGSQILINHKWRFDFDMHIYI